MWAETMGWNAPNVLGENMRKSTHITPFFYFLSHVSIPTCFAHMIGLSVLRFIPKIMLELVPVTTPKLLSGITPKTRLTTRRTPHHHA